MNVKMSKVEKSRMQRKNKGGAKSKISPKFLGMSKCLISV